MNKFLKVVLILIPIALATVAGAFSILGAMEMFSGAAIGVAIMFSILEGSKLVIASTLQRTWSVLSNGLKAYLISALIVIMFITSVGIYGFLSGAYQKTKTNFELELSKNDTISIRFNKMESLASSLQERADAKSTELTKLEELRTSQESRATNTTAGTSSVDNLQAKTTKQIEKLQSQIDSLSTLALTYQDSANMFQSKMEQNRLTASNNAELGPLVFISQLTGWAMDKIVNIFILLIIFTFDPLSVILALTQPFISKAEDKEKEDNAKKIELEKKENIELVLDENDIVDLFDEEEIVTETQKPATIFDDINQSRNTENMSIAIQLQEKNKQELPAVETEIVQEEVPVKKKTRGRPKTKDFKARISSVAEQLPTIENQEVTQTKDVPVIKEKRVSKKELERQEKAKRLYSGEIKSDDLTAEEENNEIQ